MTCYRDMTFCGSDCVNRACFRNVTEKVKQSAAETNLPLALRDFSPGCDDYKAPAQD